MKATLLCLVALAACGLPAELEPEPLAPEPVAPATPTAATWTPVTSAQAVMTPLPRPNEVTRVLKDTTTPIVLTLDADTVFCSALGYGVSFLKVSVPDLDDLARFDHRVDALGLPCAAAGACSDTLGPDTILQGRPGLETVSVRVVLTEVLVFDRAASTCSRQLVEEVFATVRGVPLRHRVKSEPRRLDWARCQALETLARGP